MGEFYHREVVQLHLSGQAFKTVRSVVSPGATTA